MKRERERENGVGRQGKGEAKIPVGGEAGEADLSLGSGRLER